MSPHRERPCVMVRVHDWAGAYAYWTHLTDLKVDEWVIIESPRDKSGRLQWETGVPLLGQVESVTPARQQRAQATKWIIDRVEWDAYRARKALGDEVPVDAV